MEEKYIDEVRELYEREGGLVISDFTNHKDLISPTTFYRQFDSVEEAAQLAGINYERYEKVELVCKRCGSIDKRPPSFVEKYGGKEKDWCKECVKTTITCKSCGEEREKRTSVVKRDRDNHFCDRECYLEWCDSPMDHSNYGSEWEKMRKTVVESFDSQCYLCGMSEEQHNREYGGALHVHHSVPFQKYIEAGVEKEVAHRNSNLFALCAECHIGKVENSGKTVEELKIEKECVNVSE